MLKNIKIILSSRSAWEAGGSLATNVAPFQSLRSASNAGSTNSAMIFNRK